MFVNLSNYKCYVQKTNLLTTKIIKEIIESLWFCCAWLYVIFYKARWCWLKQHIFTLYWFCNMKKQDMAMKQELLLELKFIRNTNSKHFFKLYSWANITIFIGNINVIIVNKMRCNIWGIWTFPLVSCQASNA